MCQIIYCFHSPYLLTSLPGTLELSSGILAPRPAAIALGLPFIPPWSGATYVPYFVVSLCTMPPKQRPTCSPRKRTYSSPNRSESPYNLLRDSWLIEFLGTVSWFPSRRGGGGWGSCHVSQLSRGQIPLEFSFLSYGLPLQFENL